MNFAGFYGNEPIKTVLNTHWFHAYLIEGPEGSGKHTLADKITNALVCDRDPSPCGNCNQCFKFQQKCHPDVIDIPSDIPVDELRDLLAELPLLPNEAAHKIYRIDRAERLHEKAQNLLLKTLEEPPKYAVFLLLTSAKEGILPTVQSRCQTLTLAPLPEEIIREHFIQTFGEFNEKAQAATVLSAGFLGQALEYYRDGDGSELAAAKKLEAALLRNDVPEVFRIFNFEDREQLLGFYHGFTLYVKRKIRECAQEELPYYAELSRLLDGAGHAMQANVNVKFWNINLARICLKARREERVTTND